MRIGRDEKAAASENHVKNAVFSKRPRLHAFPTRMYQYPRCFKTLLAATLSAYEDHPLLKIDFNSSSDLDSNCSAFAWTSILVSFSLLIPLWAILPNASQNPMMSFPFRIRLSIRLKFSFVAEGAGSACCGPSVDIATLSSVLYSILVAEDSSTSGAFHHTDVTC